MDFTQSVKTCFSKYFVFSGRATRSEYWRFYLFTILGGFLFRFIDGLVFSGSVGGASPFGSLFNLVVLVPTLAVGCRRLHDTNHSGWWQLLPLIPVIVFVTSAVGGSGSGVGDMALGGMVVGGLAMLAAVILLIIWLATQGDYGSNRFGEDPLDGGMDVFD